MPLSAIQWECRDANDAERQTWCVFTRMLPVNRLRRMARRPGCDFPRMHYITLLICFMTFQPHSPSPSPPPSPAISYNLSLPWSSEEPSSRGSQFAPHLKHPTTHPLFSSSSPKQSNTSASHRPPSYSAPHPSHPTTHPAFNPFLLAPSNTQSSHQSPFYPSPQQFSSNFGSTHVHDHKYAPAQCEPPAPFVPNNYRDQELLPYQKPYLSPLAVPEEISPRQYLATLALATPSPLLPTCHSSYVSGTGPNDMPYVSFLKYHS